jgi:RHS repeat-associated protein
LRDRDNSSGWLTTSDGTLEERFFHLHNWRHDLIALGKSDGTLVERVKYSAYGVATRLDPADYNGDSFIDFFDDDDFDTDHTATNAKADFDYNGTVNATDSTLWDTAYLAGTITARGVLSTTNATTGTNNRAGYAGYQFSPATQKYHVRHRALNPLVGQWLERDPMEYHDGSDLYMYVRDNPVNGWDSMGLRREICQGVACDYTPIDQASRQPDGTIVVHPWAGTHHHLPPSNLTSWRRAQSFQAEDSPRRAISLRLARRVSRASGSRAFDVRSGRALPGLTTFGCMSSRRVSCWRLAMWPGWIWRAVRAWSAAWSKRPADSRVRERFSLGSGCPGRSFLAHSNSPAAS